MTVGGIVAMDNFTVAVLITAVPFALLLIYGFWIGNLPLRDGPPRECRRGGENAPERLS